MQYNQLRLISVRLIIAMWVYNKEEKKGKIMFLLFFKRYMFNHVNFRDGNQFSTDPIKIKTYIKELESIKSLLNEILSNGFTIKLFLNKFELTKISYFISNEIVGLENYLENKTRVIPINSNLFEELFKIYNILNTEFDKKDLESKADSPVNWVDYGIYLANFNRP